MFQTETYKHNINTESENEINGNDLCESFEQDKNNVRCNNALHLLYNQSSVRSQ